MRSVTLPVQQIASEREGPMESKSVHLLSAGANSARHEHEERDEGRPRCETSGRMCAFSLALLKEKVFVSRRRSGLHAAG